MSLRRLVPEDLSRHAPRTKDEVRAELEAEHREWTQRHTDGPIERCPACARIAEIERKLEALRDE